MPTAPTSEALLALVERSGLLAPERLAVHRAAVDARASALELARVLVRQRLLTPFQAHQLLRGKSRGYFLTDKYKILEHLGEGGMGQVLLCEHLLLQKLVALKLLSASWVRVPGAEERFLREARASAAVDHPNVVRVFDVDRAAGVPFMVMEYVDGKNLHQLVAEHGPLEPARAAEYTRQAAVGLHAAQKVGLVHRDIKPGNILLDRSGAVKILDLGLARFLVDSSRNDSLTERFDPGTVLGTLDFIAPEQADNSSAVDVRADVYSLGYTFYYLLTGKLPFGDGSAAQKLMWHQVRDPEPLTKVRPDLPQEFQTVFERMTRKNPGHRYQSPAEVVAALRPLIAAPVPPPPAEQMPKLRAGTFLLGLAPPPAPDVIAGAVPEPATPSGSVAETARLKSEGQPNLTGSDVLRSVTTGAGGDASPHSDPVSLPTPVGTTRFPAPPRRRWPLVAVAVGALVLGAVIAAGLLSRPREKDQDVPPGDNRGGGEPTPPIIYPPPPPKLVGPAAPLTGIVLTGEGSSFVDPMLQYWGEVYRHKTGHALRYTRSGSTAGVDAFLDKRVQFVGTDAFLTDQQVRDAGAAVGPVVHVPLVMGAVVATYNLPDLGRPLRFTGNVLADIYLGKITRWNDKALVAANAGVALPDLPITVAHRKEGSGTTFIWTDYLNKVSGAWKKPTGPGVGNEVAWPVGIAVEKNDGVAREVSRTVGAIGYVELSYALARNLPVAEVENENGVHVLPSLKSVTAAAAATDFPPDLRFTLTNAAGRDSYPISGTTWAVISRKQSGPGGRELVDFLRWAVHDGQAHVADLHYAPLPPTMIPKIDKLLTGITFDP